MRSFCAGQRSPASQRTTRSYDAQNRLTAINYLGTSAAGLPDANAGRFVSEGILQSTEGVTAHGASVIKAGQQGGLPELVIKSAEQ